MQKKEQISSVSLSNLKPFPGHPFSIKDDSEMEELIDSIKENGILSPVIVRPNENGEYEIISGHRRAHACELCGVAEIPVVIRNCTRDEAVIMMVDSNLQRRDISKVELGKAYKMKNEAIKRVAGRKPINSRQLGENYDEPWTITKIADSAGESERTIQRLMRLAELIPELQSVVEKKDMGVTTAAELSFLSPEEQTWVSQTIESDEVIPSLSQAQRIKKLSKEHALTEDSTFEILTELKKPERQNIILTPAKIGKFIPRSFSLEQAENLIIKLLEGWSKHMQAKKEQSKSINSNQQQKKTKNDHSL